MLTLGPLAGIGALPCPSKGPRCKDPAPSLAYTLMKEKKLLLDAADEMMRKGKKKDMGLLARMPLVIMLPWGLLRCFDLFVIWC